MHRRGGGGRRRAPEAPKIPAPGPVVAAGSAARSLCRLDLVVARYERQGKPLGIKKKKKKKRRRNKKKAKIIIIEKIAVKKGK